MVSVSIVICTYNRAESLGETLESLRNQSVPEGFEYEVIVVDNNSSDGTLEVVRSFQSRNGRTLRYLFESRQGVAYARNTGVKGARGRVVAFLDDDVIAEPGWLEAVWNCFEETQADAVGGRIDRKWNGERPNWYSEEIGGCFIHQEFGANRIRWNSDRQHMVTANLAFRRNVFENYGFFREELGRRGEELLGGEDREFYQRLIKEGGVVMYEPRAVVHHKVEPERLTKPFVRRWFWGVGKTLGHEVEWRWHYHFTIAPLWVWKNLFSASGDYLANFWNFRRGIAKHFSSEIWVRHYGAMIWERFSHWIPFGWGKPWCAFINEKGEK